MIMLYLEVFFYVVRWRSSRASVLVRQEHVELVVSYISPMSVARGVVVSRQAT